MHTLTHLFFDNTAENKRHARPMQMNLHQSSHHPFLLWTSVEDLANEAGRIVSTVDLCLQLVPRLSQR